mgnify:FL=1
MTPEDIQHEIRAIKQALQRAQFLLANERVDHLLSTSLSEQQRLEVHYLAAVTHRMAKQYDEAFRHIDVLLSLSPDYGRAYQELAYCHEAKGNGKEASSAFFKATHFNPALISSWKKLLSIYQRHNDVTAVQMATKQIAHLQSLPAPVLGAYDLMYEKQFAAAEQVCRQFLTKHKHHPEAMMLLAEIGMQLKVYSDAEFLLESCVELYPDNEKAALAYQNVLSKLGKFPEAVQVARQRLEHNPTSFSIKTSLAHALVGVGQLDEAITVYRDVLAENPDRPKVWVSLGHALKAKGDTPDAVSAYEKAIDYASDYGDAYWSLANTKTYKFSDALLAQMSEQLNSNAIKLEDKIHVCFALGKGLEDRGEASKAFNYYQQGNSLKRSTLQFDIARTEEALNAQQRAFSSEDFNKVEGCQAPDPIFIVGLPRAGSTLLEQILASHSKVDGTMELHDILGIASSLSHQKTPYPLNVNALDGETLEKLGARYIEQTRAYRQGAPLFIDKMPNNFIHIGLIKKILPNAKIIDARRNPMDCCFSGFKQLFGEGQEFSYSLSDIGRYYKAYEKLMDHWHAVLPGEILTVQHEEVLDDLEGQVRRILDFCGLDFEEACLAFHQTKRVIKTPSSEQVRQPIYKTGMGQWKPFDSYLADLKQALGGNTSVTNN